ncbi:MAG: hypothetical protein KDB22_23300 [Planctomycetales bacterium]|nr:hypothetical protein [Planctomycetales bacterium]
MVVYLQFAWGLLLLVTGILGPTFSARASVLLVPPFLLCFLHLLLAYRMWQKEGRMWPVYIATVVVPILWSVLVYPMVPFSTGPYQGGYGGGFVVILFGLPLLAAWFSLQLLTRSAIARIQRPQAEATPRPRHYHSLKWWLLVPTFAVAVAALDVGPVWKRISERQVAIEEMESLSEEISREAMRGYAEFLQACGADDPEAIALARAQFTDLQNRCPSNWNLKWVDLHYLSGLGHEDPSVRIETVRLYDHYLRSTTPSYLNSDHLVGTFSTLLHDPQTDPALREAALIVLSRHGSGTRLHWDLDKMLRRPSDYAFASGTLKSLLADKSLRGLSTSSEEQIKEILKKIP